MELENNKFTRRSMLKSTILSSAVIAPILSFPLLGQAEELKDKTIPAGKDDQFTEEEEFPSFKFRFRDSPKRTYPEGWAREATVKQFPVSKGLAGVDMYLNPGAARELHWHAIAAEWGYILEGAVRITTIDPEGKSETTDCGKGDIFYFPKGYGHSIQAFDQGSHFILIFDSGYFSEFGTFSVTDWVAHTPEAVIAASTGLPSKLFAGLPDQEKYMVPGKVPAPLKLDPDEDVSDSPLTHKFRFTSQNPIFKSAGGSVKVASAVEFPISKTITGVLEIIKPNAVRELHWHPNADEWQYYISGKGRMTVFGSSGRARTDDFEATDVGYVPQGYGHYIENTGEEDLVVLIGLNSGKYEDISLSDWIATNTNELVADHFNGTAADYSNKPKGKIIIGLKA